jgi:multidrug efflux system membrane fusion protein
MALASSRKLIGVIVVVLVAAAGAYYWFKVRGGEPATETKTVAAKGKGKGGFDSNRATPVVAEAARKSDIKVFLNGLGTIVPLRTVTVRSRVEGELLRINFTEGQVVKQGDLLAEIDPRPFQVQLAQAEGQLAKDQALLTNARIDLERYQTLFKQDSIAKQQVDTQAALVRQYEGSLRTDEAQVQNARLQLTYARITAPISGRLGLRLVDVGNIVRGGDSTGLVVITQTQPISAVFTIPQDSLPQMMKRLGGSEKKDGEKIPVEAWDRENKVRLATGTLITVDNQIDPTTGTVKLKAQFGNEDLALFANQFVNIRMLVDTRQEVTTVPAAALQRGSQGFFVYVVRDDNTVTVRGVKPGPTEGERVAIEAGIQPGERVVTDGVDRLREGARVEVASARPTFPDKSGEGRKGGRKKAAEK